MGVSSSFAFILVLSITPLFTFSLSLSPPLALSLSLIYTHTHTHALTVDRAFPYLERDGFEQKPEKVFTTTQNGHSGHVTRVREKSCRTRKKHDLIFHARSKSSETELSVAEENEPVLF